MKKLILLISVAALAACSNTNSGSGLVSGAKRYPLDTCIVSDNKLGSMGTPVSLVHEGQEVKFCCKACVSKFRKDPAKYLAKIRA